MNGTLIPARATMLVFPYATHRHPEFWQEPERFDPERWLPERAATMNQYAYHPFGSGQRICLDNNFAMLEAHVLTAMLVRNFKARLKPGHEPRFETAGTLIVPNGLPMTIHAR